VENGISDFSTSYPKNERIQQAENKIYRALEEPVGSVLLNERVKDALLKKKY
jgi:hypothetical protein